MKTNKKHGISLIVLVITIIVMIILATTVVITLNNSGIIALSNKAVFQQNAKNYLTELELYMAEQIMENPRLNTEEINSTDETLGLMITSMKEEDKFKFTVKGGELLYNGVNAKEIEWCNEIGIAVITGYDTAQNVNTPKLSEGMIPVKYDESTSSWVKADVTNANDDWYKYDSETRQWANVVTVKEVGIKTRKYYQEAANGTPIDMSDITTMFVWIPRYAYSINEGYYKVADSLSEDAEASNQKIDITFLVGNGNLGEETDGAYTKYETDYDASSVSAGEATPKIVHPAFTFGEDELTGIWVAKFEASGSTATPSDLSSYPGNATESSNTTPTITDATYVTILPSVPSWRHITIGNAQVQSMRMALDTNDAYGFVNVDTHLMKNVELGAVAYLSASEYGKVPMQNSKGSHSSTASTYYDLLTGYQGSSDEYNTEAGMKASTTHNVYGIYDMNGGAWERVAGYLDNGSSYLSYYAGQYFENNTLKSEYTKYWDKYDVSEEEKTDKIQVADLGDGVTEVSKSVLWSLTRTVDGEDKYTTDWNEARYRITKATYNLMALKKGDAMYETMADNSYYGLYKKSDTEYGWSWIREKDSTTASWATTWNSDGSLIGHANLAFVYRGGNYDYGTNAGVFYTSMNYGHADGDYGFRPVCVAL